MKNNSKNRKWIYIWIKNIIRIMYPYLSNQELKAEMYWIKIDIDKYTKLNGKFGICIHYNYVTHKFKKKQIDDLIPEFEIFFEKKK